MLKVILAKAAVNLPIVAVVGLAVSTSGLAAYKLASDVPEVNAQVSSVKTVDSVENDDNASVLFYDDSVQGFSGGYQDDSDMTISQTEGTNSTSVQSSSNTSLIAAAQQFTLAQLAMHNLPGDCFVAYSGKVYDVSDHNSWTSCRHHGITGGTDITSRFPHPTSYFNSLPVVGTLVGGTTATGIGASYDDDDGDDDIDDNSRDSRDSDREHEDDDDDDMESSVTVPTVFNGAVSNLING